MDIVLGLGSAGCKIADAFAGYPQYQTYKIDVEIEGENCFSLEAGNSHQEYEETLPDLSDFIKTFPEGDILFVVAGSGYVSGASLKILQYLKDRKISVLYIKPDNDLISGERSLQERLVYRVFQEYARSGLFERMYLAHNPTIEKLLGDVPIKEYYERLNNVLVSTLHMINVFSHAEPVHEQSIPKLNSTRISTFGVLSFEKNKESFFFPLDNVSELDYYYAINDSVLEKDVKLFGKIKEQMRERKANGHERVNYFVYSTNYADTLGYCLAHTNEIQTFPEKSEKELDKP